MPAIVGRVDFNPDKEIPSLTRKVIFVTGGTAGIGEATIRHFAAHSASHIYFSGRNFKAGNALIADLKSKHPEVGLTFIQMDFTSLASVKSALAQHFVHSRLDILICNAGIMAQQMKLSADGYDIQFAVNHLGNAMVTHRLLPVLLSTAAEPKSDVRVINITSLGYRSHPKEGIAFDELNAHSMQNRFIAGPWIRYGQSKLANILSSSHLARLHPSITAVSVHPGIVSTDLVHTQTLINRVFIKTATALTGIPYLEPEQGAWNTVWCATVAKKKALKNGGFYIPVGEERSKDLAKYKWAVSKELAAKLWEWTEEVLAKV